MHCPSFLAVTHMPQLDLFDKERFNLASLVQKSYGLKRSNFGLTGLTDKNYCFFMKSKATLVRMCRDKLLV